MYTPCGSKIREIRDRRCLTQTELAERVGVSRSAVSAWEGAYRLPHRKHLRSLAEALSCSIEDLCTQTGDRGETRIAIQRQPEAGPDHEALLTLDAMLHELNAMIELLGTAREEFLGAGESLSVARAGMANNNIWAAELGLQHLHDAYRRWVDDQYKKMKEEVS